MRMHGVTGLESNHFFPAAFADFTADFNSGFECAEEIFCKVRKVKYLNRAGDAGFANRVKCSNADMVRIIRAVNFFGHGAHLFVSELFNGFDILNGENRVPFDVRIQKGDSFGFLDGGCILNHVE
jgi:hypothetical protein